MFFFPKFHAYITVTSLAIVIVITNIAMMSEN